MSYMAPPRFGQMRSFMTVGGRAAGWLVPATYAISGLAFVSDLTRSNTIAYGIFYTPLVATAVFHQRRGGLWILTAAACLFVVIGAFLPVVDPNLPDLIGNRILSILAILATAAFVHHARTIQERLIAQTRRAEAAERIKTEVFTNLSREMRTPLHALLGLLSLMMATCRSDQLEALGRVRSGGKQLLDTIDNLIDLTQIDDLPLQQQTVDVATILREAVNDAHSAAKEHAAVLQVNLPAQADAMAIGDAWATRRILDNLITNAIRFARPGGTVSIALDQTAGAVTLSVSDTGPGLPPGLTRHVLDGIDDDAAPTAGGAGLTLSERLAQLMNGRLTVIDQADSGTTVSLTLPAA